MSRARATPFTEVVTAAREQAQRRVEPPRTPGPGGGPVFVDRAGRVHRRVCDDVDAGRALAAARGGAAVVTDSCGCGGVDHLRWLDAERVAALVAWGPPRIRRTKRHTGWISEWTADDGRVLLYVVRDVEWGDPDDTTGSAEPTRLPARRGAGGPRG